MQIPVSTINRDVLYLRSQAKENIRKYVDERLPDGQEVNMAKPSDILGRLEKMAKKEFVPSIGPIKGRIITNIIKKYNPKNILEVGTLYGYSAIHVFVC